MVEHSSITQLQLRCCNYYCSGRIQIISIGIIMSKVVFTIQKLLTELLIALEKLMEAEK